MSNAALIQLAETFGLQTRWRNADGALKTVEPESLRAILSAMGVEAGSPAEIRDSQARLQARRETNPPLLTADVGREVELLGRELGLAGRLTLESGEARDIWMKATPRGVSFRAPDSPGYHRLEVGDREIGMAVAPRRGFGVQDRVRSGRAWGAAVQVYSLGSQGAFGDFGDLAAFASAAGRRGAQALAISPVHALFAADPSRYSPYAPSSRLFLNALFADPDVIPGAAEPRLARIARGDLIDWAAAARAKLTRLRGAYRRLIDHGGEALQTFHGFRREGGRNLERHARFETLHAHFLQETGARVWQDWPKAFHDPESLKVSAFVRARADEVAFHAFLQWLADAGLARAQEAAKAGGMKIGLIADLAVGLDPGGSQAWSRPDDLLQGVAVGAPPDIFQPLGQNWGVAALSPDTLRARGYDAFLATLRRALHPCGGVRIDHVMGLRRLWLTPDGASPAQGAYLTYPFDDLVRLIALESDRARAIVIGEDLGTVPQGFREALHDRNVLGMGVLWFERVAGSDAFQPPDAWDACATAMTTTHDLPTVAGWWSGRDIDWRARLAPVGQACDAEKAQADILDARAARAQDRDRLWTACVAAGVAAGEAPPAERPQSAVDAAIAYVAASACPLAIIPVEDLIGADEQPNWPGTVDEHPNWRRRLWAGADELLDAPAVAARLAALRQARPG